MHDLRKILIFTAFLFLYFIINSFPQQRNLLIEFCTGTWCPWCPCGDYTIENLLAVHPNLIPLAYHGPVGSDPYASFTGNEIIGLLGFAGYPTATVDRASSPGDYTTWTSKVNSRINVPATVSITILGTFNPSNRLLNLSIKSTALQNLTGDFRLNLVLVEDSLIYNQSNNGVCVPGGTNWVHDWVVRSMINGALGESLIAGSWNANEIITKNISYSVPSNYNKDKCSIVAFVYKQSSPMYAAQVQQAEKISINNLTESFIAVISPNGGENLLAGSNFDITWLAENTDSVGIKYTTDAGVTWLSIIDSYPNSGTYSWEVPNTTSVNCRIRISSLANPLIFDESNNWFSIYLMQFDVFTGWNLISVPILSEDMSKTFLFPTAVSPAYGYDNGYNIVDTLRNEVGYWVKFNSNETISLHGNYVTQNTINVVSGWNLIGPFDETIDISSITTQPPDIIISPFFGFGGGYYIANTLEPGFGYWIKTNSSGSIQLNTDLSE
jgi:hypothetical protein